MVVTFATSTGSEFKKPKMRKAQWKGIKGEKGESGTQVCLSAFSLPGEHDSHKYPVSFIRSCRHMLIQELED